MGEAVDHGVHWVLVTCAVGHAAMSQGGPVLHQDHLLAPDGVCIRPQSPSESVTTTCRARVQLAGGLLQLLNILLDSTGPSLKAA